MSRRDISYLLGHAPRFNGIVAESTDEYIYVELYDDDPLHADYPVIRVSLNVVRSDMRQSSYAIGDGVLVLYDGSLTSNEPVTAEMVYAILLKMPADAVAPNNTESTTNGPSLYKQ